FAASAVSRKPGRLSAAEKIALAKHDDLVSEAFESFKALPAGHPTALHVPQKKQFHCSQPQFRQTTAAHSSSDGNRGTGSDASARARTRWDNVRTALLNPGWSPSISSTHAVL